jgi:hypothetical protein
LVIPADDPEATKVFVKPREVLTGNIDLRYFIRDLAAMKKSDVLLFWAHESPEELHIPRWLAGLVVLTQQR